MFHALPGLDVNRLLLATFRCELCLGPATLDPLYRVIVWSLNAAGWRNLPWWTQNKPSINLEMVFINHNVGSCLCLGLSRNWQQLIYIYIRLARGFKKEGPILVFDHVWRNLGGIWWCLSIGGYGGTTIDWSSCSQSWFQNPWWAIFSGIYPVGCIKHRIFNIHQCFLYIAPNSNEVINNNNSGIWHKVPWSGEIGNGTGNLGTYDDIGLGNTAYVSNASPQQGMAPMCGLHSGPLFCFTISWQ